MHLSRLRKEDWAVSSSDDSHRSADEVSLRIDAARYGSRAALGELLAAYHGYLLMIASEELPDELRGKLGASDLVQETFLEAQRDFAQFQGTTEEELLGWLRRILVNNLLSACRRHGTEKREMSREEVLRPDLADAGPSPLAALLARETDAALCEALERLPTHYREVVLWRNYERQSFTDIGRRLNRSADSARKLWARAIELLQEEMDQSNERP